MMLRKIFGSNMEMLKGGWRKFKRDLGK